MELPKATVRFEPEETTRVRTRMFPPTKNKAFILYKTLLRNPKALDCINKGGKGLRWPKGITQSEIEDAKRFYNNTIKAREIHRQSAMQKNLQ